MDSQSVMQSNMAITIVSIVGALVTVLIGVSVHDRQAREAARIENALSAYGEYIGAVAAVVRAQRSLSEARRQSLQAAVEAAAQSEAEALERLTAAKGAITLYGDGPIVDALSKVENKLESCSDIDSFLKVVEAIRVHAGADAVPREDLKKILF